MDIFVRGLADQMTEKQVNKYFTPYLNRLGISVWKCDKLKSKGCAIITIVDIAKAQQFLRIHGDSSRIGAQGPRPVRQPLFHMNRQVCCVESKTKPDPFIISSLEKEEKEKSLKALVPRKLDVNPDGTLIYRTFDTCQLWCGQWDYQGDDLVFADYYRCSRLGQINFATHGLFIKVFSESRQTAVPDESHLEIPYRTIESFTTGSQTDPSITFSLKETPKMFEKISEHQASNSGNALLDAMNKLLIDANKSSPLKRRRVTSFDEAHSTVVASCLCYRFLLLRSTDIRSVQSLKRFPEYPGSITYTTSIAMLPPFASQMSVLNSTLAAYQNLPFSVKFQLQRLAQNGSLAPYRVSRLLVAINAQITSENSKAFVDAVYQLYGRLPFPGPNIEASRFSLESLLDQVIQSRDRVDIGGSFAENWGQYEHLVLIHKAQVTPAGIYLEGPQAEVKNRVLRKYAMYSDYFLSVSFSDEDGEAIRHDRQTSNDEMFRVRFRKVLEGVINIAGRGYEFLGFSHSSLREHTCWFMAPFVLRGSLIYARSVIKNLGDFTRIRSPAKCAARIGQAFSQTLSSFTLPLEAITVMPDIERNGRVFSDGVGTCSKDVLQRVWSGTRTTGNLKPTVLQVRIQGAKGVLSFDSALAGLAVRLRPSMIKFEGTNVSDVEICGSAVKPLPMFLNRQVIKILEDLGVEDEAFMKMQSDAVDNLRATTNSANHAAEFLSRNYIGMAARLPWLVHKLWQLDLHFGDDDFLKAILELAVLTQLRQLKYKARIRVEQGVTLYGIMDETGILKEDQIYCSVMSDIVTGSVVITRCPALHPGDIRCVNAVNVPVESPLRDLHNVIVFSQRGQRDLPSMLSGGDLDGDLYNVIYDPALYPRKLYQPAEYSAPKPIDIGKLVETSDMTNHFLSFMENDALGMIATLHQIIADQSKLGVLDDVCIHLASLHSDAVDFSKTGIPVPIGSIPKYPTARPDFLAHGPRVTIDKGLKIDSEDASTLFEEDDPPEPISEAQSYEPRKIRYYESQKILGKLYRSIDEHMFLNQLQKQAQSSSQPNQDVIGTVWNYVRNKCLLIPWEQCLDTAKDIKESYEDNLVDTMMNYSTNPNEFASEVEVFSGCILGKDGGLSKRLRELSKEVKSKFDRDVAYTVQCIKKGDEGDEQDSLARSIACFFVSLTTHNTRQKVGKLISFQWIAAAICLKEVEDMNQTTTRT